MDSKDELLEDPFADPFDDGSGGFAGFDDDDLGMSSQLQDDDHFHDSRASSKPLRGFSTSIMDAGAGLTSAGSKPIFPALGNPMILQNDINKMQRRSAKEAAYLGYSKRGLYERAMFNAGCMYLGGALSNLPPVQVSRCCPLPRRDAHVCVPRRLRFRRVSLPEGSSCSARRACFILVQTWRVLGGTLHPCG
jgi:hypothetical protein